MFRVSCGEFPRLIAIAFKFNFITMTQAVDSSQFRFNFQPNGRKFDLFQNDISNWYRNTLRAWPICLFEMPFTFYISTRRHSHLHTQTQKWQMYRNGSISINHTIQYELSKIRIKQSEKKWIDDDGSIWKHGKELKMCGL